MSRYEFSDQHTDTYTVRVKDREGNTLHTYIGATHAEAVAFKAGWRAAEQAGDRRAPEDE